MSSCVLCVQFLVYVHFLWGSILTFLCVFGYFLLLIGILFCLMFFLDFYLTLSLLND